MHIGENIIRYRKEKKWTQARLAQELGLSFQAVSKWENNQAFPDIQLLPKIAACLNVSCDILLGYHPILSTVNEYESIYQSKEYYWGTQPTELSMKVLSYLPPYQNPTLIDLGCREGQNVLFFARNGYRTIGIEVSESGIKKGRLLAHHWNVQAEFICASFLDYHPTENFDIVFCDDALHMIEPKFMQDFIDVYKFHTTPGGIHVINIPVEKPFLNVIEQKTKRYPWYSGELFTLYADWRILECSETEPISTSRSTIPQIYNYVIAQKPL